jgi:hypothetical protein
MARAAHDEGEADGADPVRWMHGSRAAWDRRVNCIVLHRYRGSMRAVWTGKRKRRWVMRRGMQDGELLMDAGMWVRVREIRDDIESL